MKPNTKALRHALSVLLSACLIFALCPLGAAAESGGSAGTSGTGLCEHHTAHDESCGYSEGTPCSHVHDEDCCRLVTKCVHKHTDECYPDGGVLPLPVMRQGPPNALTNAARRKAASPESLTAPTSMTKAAATAGARPAAMSAKYALMAALLSSHPGNI